MVWSVLKWAPKRSLDPYECHVIFCCCRGSEGQFPAVSEPLCQGLSLGIFSGRGCVTPAPRPCRNNEKKEERCWRYSQLIQHILSCICVILLGLFSCPRLNFIRNVCSVLHSALVPSPSDLYTCEPLQIEAAHGCDNIPDVLLFETQDSLSSTY